MSAQTTLDIQRGDNAGFYWVRSDDTDAVGEVLDIEGNDKCEYFRLTENEAVQVIRLTFPDCFTRVDILKMLQTARDNGQNRVAVTL